MLATMRIAHCNGFLRRVATVCRRWQPHRCSGTCYFAAVQPTTSSVETYMTTALQRIHEAVPLAKAAGILAEGRYSALPVVNDHGSIVGVISRSDIVHARVGDGRHALALPDTTVAHVMSQGPLVVSPAATMLDAARSMTELGVHRLFVVDHGKLVGVLSTLDVARALEQTRSPAPLRPFVTPVIKAVADTTPVQEAVAVLDAAGVSSLVVVDGDWPVGTFGQLDALLARNGAANQPVSEVMERAIVCMPPDTKLWHAASQVVAMDVRRIIVCERGQTVGITSTLDLARAFVTLGTGA